MDPMTKAFVAGIHGFVAARGLELVSFGKERKDDVAQQFLARFTGSGTAVRRPSAGEGAGVAHAATLQPAHGETYAWLVRSTAFINYFYFYCVDDDFGPFFIKFSTYFPYTAKLCINGNEWAKRQAAKAGIAFEALDNGFAAVDDVDRLQNICDSLGPDQIDALLRKWLRILPQPVHRRRRSSRLPLRTVDPAGGVLPDPDLDRPVSGRICFEQVLRDNLDIGRPDQVALIFDRRIIEQGPPPDAGPLPHPGHHRGCHPVAARRLQEHQDQAVPQAREGTENRDHDQRHPRLQVERLTSLPALRQLGFTANRRLLGVQIRQPRPDPRRPGIHRPHHPDPHRRRRTHPRTSLRRQPRSRPPAGPAHPPAPTQRVHQP